MFQHWFCIVSRNGIWERCRLYLEKWNRMCYSSGNICCLVTMKPTDYDGTFHSGNFPVATPAAVGPTRWWTFTRPKTWPLQVAPSPFCPGRWRIKAGFACLIRRGQPVGKPRGLPIHSQKIFSRLLDCNLDSVCHEPSKGSTVTAATSIWFPSIIIARRRQQFGASSIRPSYLHGWKNFLAVINEHFVIGDVTLWEYSLCPIQLFVPLFLWTYNSCIWFDGHLYCLLKMNWPPNYNYLNNGDPCVFFVKICIQIYCTRHL